MLVAQDGLHPSGTMYARWVDSILPFLILLEMNKLEKHKNEKRSFSPLLNSVFHPENEIYLDGNSLGKLPLKAKENVSMLMQEQWGENLIRSWNDHWLDLPKRIAAKLALLLKADPKEILVGESTSVNLYKVAHALIESGHYPKQFLTDSLNFPTDNYILEGISREKGMSKPICVEYPSDLKADLNLLKNKITLHPGVICLSLVSYKSAYYYPMKALNLHAKEHNSIIIWDLSRDWGCRYRSKRTNPRCYRMHLQIPQRRTRPLPFLFRQNPYPNLSSPIQGWFGHARLF